MWCRIWQGTSHCGVEYGRVLYRARSNQKPRVLLIGPQCNMIKLLSEHKDLNIYTVVQLVVNVWYKNLNINTVVQLIVNAWHRDLNIL